MTGNSLHIAGGTLPVPHGRPSPSIGSPLSSRLRGSAGLRAGDGNDILALRQYLYLLPASLVVASGVDVDSLTSSDGDALEREGVEGSIPDGTGATTG